MNTHIRHRNCVNSFLAWSVAIIYSVSESVPTRNVITDHICQLALNQLQQKCLSHSQDGGGDSWGCFGRVTRRWGSAGLLTLPPPPPPPPNIETNIYAIRNNNYSPVHSGSNEVVLLQSTPQRPSIYLYTCHDL